MLEIQDLHVHYGAIHALKGVNLQIKQGEIVTLIGPNGAGKSTTAPEIVQKAFSIHEFVNADTIARGLSEVAPEQVAFSAGRIFLSRIYELQAAQASFAFETTLATRLFLPMLRRMQVGGYEVHLIFLWLPVPEMAIERVEASKFQLQYRS